VVIFAIAQVSRDLLYALVCVFAAVGVLTGDVKQCWILTDSDAFTARRWQDEGDD